MMRSNMLVGMLCAGLLCACAAPPPSPYEPVATDASSRVQFVKFDNPHICVAGHLYTLTQDENGAVSVPADRPVHLIGFYRRAGGHCWPAVQFVPRVGQTYDVVNDVRAERCIVNVMRHDASAQFSRRIEPSGNANNVCRQ